MAKVLTNINPGSRSRLNKKTGKKMRTIRTKVYQFSELSKAAQDKVINDRINDMIQYEAADHCENWPEFKKAIEKAEAMQTPWFAGSYVFEYCGKDIISALEDSTEAQYTKDGNYFYS